MQTRPMGRRALAAALPKSPVRLQQLLLAALFLVPALIMLGVFMIYPIFATLRLSLYQWSGVGPQTWAGLSNFRYIFTEDRVFRQALAHSFAFVLLGGGVIILLAFTLAYLLYSKVPGARVYRVMYFIPFILPGLVVSILWKTIYDPNFGLLNAGLKAIGLDQLTRVWLGDLDITLYAVIWVYIWRTFPFHMILFFVAMQDMPQELLEAAVLDGTKSLQLIRYIIIPLLSPVILVVCVLTILWGLRVFDIVYVMTRGGPGHVTQTVTTWLVTTAFFYGRFGVGAAMAFVLFVLIVVLTVLPMRFRAGIYG